jgi:hypothetical protein
VPLLLEWGFLSAETLDLSPPVSQAMKSKDNNRNGWGLLPLRKYCQSGATKDH